MSPKDLQEVVLRITTKERPEGELNKISYISSDASTSGREVVVGEGGKRRENHLAIKIPYFSKNVFYEPAGIKQKVYCDKYIPIVPCMNTENAKKVSKLGY